MFGCEIGVSQAHAREKQGAMGAVVCSRRGEKGLILLCLLLLHGNMVASYERLESIAARGSGGWMRRVVDSSRVS